MAGRGLAGPGMAWQGKQKPKPERYSGNKYVNFLEKRNDFDEKNNESGQEPQERPHQYCKSG